MLGWGSPGLTLDALNVKLLCGCMRFKIVKHSCDFNYGAKLLYSFETKKTVIRFSFLFSRILLNHNPLPKRLRRRLVRSELTRLQYSDLLHCSVSSPISLSYCEESGRSEESTIEWISSRAQQDSQTLP